MSKYKELEMSYGGSQFIFVTRGRSKPFTAEEAIGFLQDRVTKSSPSENVSPEVAPLGYDNVEQSVREEIYDCGESVWRIPDDKMRRHMFRTDLKEGMAFCVKKYGQSVEVIEAEAKRLSLRGF